MSHRAKTTLGRYKDPVVIVCERCGRETSHNILTGVLVEDSSPDGDILVWDDYTVVQCAGCKNVSFCRDSRSTEDTDPEGEHLISTYTVFPPRIAGRKLLEDYYYLPAAIRNIYEETRAAIIQGMPILAGIGIRAIVETVCNEKGTKGGNLKERITSLVNLHLITPKEGEILQELRFLGNAAAHEAKAHDAEDLEIAFDISEHLLQTVYLLDRKHKKLLKKKAAADES